MISLVEALVGVARLIASIFEFLCNVGSLVQAIYDSACGIRWLLSANYRREIRDVKDHSRKAIKQLGIFFGILWISGIFVALIYLLFIYKAA